MTNLFRLSKDQLLHLFRGWRSCSNHFSSSASWVFFFFYAQLSTLVFFPSSFFLRRRIPEDGSVERWYPRDRLWQSVQGLWSRQEWTLIQFLSDRETYSNSVLLSAVVIAEDMHGGCMFEVVCLDRVETVTVALWHWRPTGARRTDESCWWDYSTWGNYCHDPGLRRNLWVPHPRLPVCNGGTLTTLCVRSAGLMVGDPVQRTRKSLSVELGPGVFWMWSSAM